MPKFSVTKSIIINAPAEKVYDTVRDFRNWMPWSPWLIAEPECKVACSDDGNSYSWDGKIVGSGEMTVVEEKAPREILYRLTFLKPWKSVSDVSFRFAERDDGTEATWTMDGSLPFFMFWMKPMMTAFIGMDYQRGLNMLKDYIETGSVPSKLEFPGVQSFSGFRFVGIRTRCSMADIASSMGDDFKKIQDTLCGKNMEASGKPFSMYHKWQLVKGFTEYTLGYPVATAPSNLPAGIVSGEIPSCQVYSVRHTGPYRHLGNPWSAGMMHGRSKLFKQSKAIPPFEVYENDPDETPDNDLVTTVNFPVR